MVRRIWRNNAVRIAACTTMGAAATMTNIAIQVCMPTPAAPRKDGLHSPRLQKPITPCKFSGLRRLAEVRLAPGFHRRRNRILLADRYVLAALDQFIDRKSTR